MRLKRSKGEESASYWRLCKLKCRFPDWCLQSCNKGNFMSSSGSCLFHRAWCVTSQAFLGVQMWDVRGRCPFVQQVKSNAALLNFVLGLAEPTYCPFEGQNMQRKGTI